MIDYISPLRSLAVSDLATLDAALAAIAETRAAAAEEDATFARWIRFERDASGKLIVHGNTVKAAERRHERALDRSQDAVDAAYRIDRDAIGAAWGYDHTSDDVVRAISIVRDAAIRRIRSLS